jgi:hypothetical protein
MGPFSRKPRRPQIHIGDPRFDGWETVDEYDDLSTAAAFAGRLAELYIPNALTADWPLDELGRGTIYLQVPADRYDDATLTLEGWDT